MSRDLTGDILIRNSNRPDEWIQDTNWAFAVFIAGAKAGEFDHLIDDEVGQPTHAELHAEIARLSVEVEKLQSALRHPSSRKVRVHGPTALAQLRDMVDEPVCPEETWPPPWVDSVQHDELS